MTTQTAQLDWVCKWPDYWLAVCDAGRYALALEGQLWNTMLNGETIIYAGSLELAKRTAEAHYRRSQR